MNADSTITLTRFVSVGARSQTLLHISLVGLADTIQRTTAPAKERLQLLKLARFGNLRTDKGSLRHDGNLTTITGIEADYDGGKMTFEEAQEILEKQGLASLLHTSPSFTEDSPRWRALCPLSEEMAPNHRDHYVARVNGLFGGIFAGESFTLSQAYYFGSVASNPSHRVAIIEGQTIDEHDDLDTIAIRKPATATTAGSGGAGQDARDDAELVRRIVTGEGLHVELCALSARYAARGIPGETVRGLLQGLMLSTPEAARDARWRDRYDDIGRTVWSGRSKFKNRAEPDRKSMARLALSLVRQQRPENEVRWHVAQAAEAIGLTVEDADAVIEWARGTLARETSHAA